MLEHIKPDYIHILYQGQIIKTGDWQLVHQIEDKGYDDIAKNSKVYHG